MQDDEIIPLILKDRDIPCPGCGYNLRDVRERRCPECGQALALHSQAVTLMDGSGGPITQKGDGILQLAIGGVVGMSFILFMAAMMMVLGMMGDFVLRDLLVVGGLLVVHVSWAIAMIVNKRRLIRMRTGWWILLPLSWWWLLSPACGAVIAVVYGQFL